MRRNPGNIFDSRRALAAIAVLLCSAIAGCPPRTEPMGGPLGEALPVAQALAIVNSNLQKAHGALKASGRVTVHYTDKKGTKHTESLDGKLIVLPPRHLRFDMTVFDKTQVLLGSNAQAFWALITPNGDMYRWGHYDAIPAGATSDELPVRPDLIVDALGLNQLPGQDSLSDGPAQRLEDEYQQILFMAQDAENRSYLQREFWIERRDPRLVRRVFFRDPLGRIAVHSQLDDYRPISDTGPQLPFKINIAWPTQKGDMQFNVKEWVVISGATTMAPSFRPPHEQGKNFEDSRCVDDDWKTPSDPD